MRTVNRERESYCYKPFADTDLHSFAGSDGEQEEYCAENNNAAKQHYAHVEYVAGDNDDNQIEFESGKWLSLSKSDYLLKIAKSQQKNNETNCCAINDNNKSQLHADWNSIIEEIENANNEDETNNKCSISSSKKSLTTTEKMLRVAIGFSVVLMCAQGVSALSTTGHDVININNVDDLNMIGKNPSYPTDGNYEFTDSFDASDFKEPIKYFNGSINGNCHTLYNTTNCLVENLAGYGVIQNLIINGANITNATCGAAIVDNVSGNAELKFIRVEDSFIHGLNFTKYLGSVASVLTGNGRIKNVVVIDTEVELLGYNIDGGTFIRYIGGVVGIADDSSKLNNITAINLNIVIDGLDSDVGGIVGHMAGMSQGRNISAINTKVTVTVKAVNSEVNSGGIVGSIHPINGDILLDDIASINITAITILFTNTESFSDIASGGIVGYVDEDSSGKVKINRVLTISSLISGRAFSYRLGCVFGMSHNLVSDNLVCINTKVDGVFPSTMTGYGYAGGLFGMIRGGNPNITALVMNSNINGFDASSSYVGGVAGSGKFSSAMNNGVMFINSSLEDSGKIVKVCYSGSKSGVDCLAEGVVFSAGQAFNTSEGFVYPYQYTMENITDDCSWVKLYFLSDSCVTDKPKFKEFQQSDRWDPDFCSIREQITTKVTVHPAEVTVYFDKEDTDGKSTTLAVVSGASAAVLLSYCGCQWFVGYRKGDRGMDLIKRPITKVFCCCSCSEHSAVPREDNKDEDEDEDVEAEKIPLN